MQSTVVTRGITDGAQSRSFPFLNWKPRTQRIEALNAIAAAIAASLLIVLVALPDDTETARSATGSEFAREVTARERVFGGYLGAPYHYPSDFWFRKDGTHDFRIKDIAWYTRPFEVPLYYGARIQSWRQYSPFGTMIDFTHSKAYSTMNEEKSFEGTINGQPAPPQAKISDFFNRLEWTHGHNMLTLNGLVRFGAFGLFQPYGGIGAGVSLPHSEIWLKSDPARTYEYQYAGPCVQALIGLELKLRSGSIFLEYKFTFADYSGPITHDEGSWLPFDLWRQFSRWWEASPPPGGFAGARLASHQVIGGVLVRTGGVRR